MDTGNFIVHVKKMIFTKVLQKMLKQDLALQILKQTEYYLKEKIIVLMKDELSGQIMNEFVELANSYNYLKDNNDEDKKSKGTKNCIIKRKHKCRDYKNCSEAAQIGKKINYLEKNKFDIDSLKEDKKEFIKKNKPILKT